MSIHQFHWRNDNHKMASKACHSFQWITIGVSNLEFYSRSLFEVKLFNYFLVWFFFPHYVFPCISHSPQKSLLQCERLHLTSAHANIQGGKRKLSLKPRNSAILPENWPCCAHTCTPRFRVYAQGLSENWTALSSPAWLKNILHLIFYSAHRRQGKMNAKVPATNLTSNFSPFPNPESPSRLPSPAKVKS